MQRRRAILDMHKNELHFCGPADYDIASVLPPGTETYKLSVAATGHLLLPCTQFEQFDDQQKRGDAVYDKNVVAQAPTPAKL